MVIPPEVPGLVLLAAAAALAGGRPARLLGAGILALAFGTASARVALQLGPDSILTADLLLPLAASARAVDGGLAASGLLAAASALPGALRHVSTIRQWALALLLLSGLVMSADASTELMRSGSWPATLAVVIIVAAVGLLALRLQAHAGWRSFSRRFCRALWGPRHPLSASGSATGWLAVAALGMLLCVAAPHALVMLAGAVIAATAGHIGFRRLGAVGKLPLLPLVAVPALLVVGYYLRLIAGPVGLKIGAFPDVPLSPAAQVMLAPWLIAAAGLFAGPIALRRWLPGSAFALVGVALLLRVGHPLLGDALPGWETLFVPVGVLMLWLAALAGAWNPAAGIAAWMVALVVAPAASAGAWCLAAAALALVLRRRANEPGGVALVLMLAAAGCGAAGAAGALAALLQHQVVYAGAAAIAALLLVFGAGDDEPVIYSAGSPDLTAHSGAAHGVHASSSSL
ncbi:MAG TPA: hypothetical protein VFL88_03075 [Gemmatimonadales bacterium]|nr:hypothetical protein [Gemmatimonadales bacterium]